MTTENGSVIWVICDESGKFGGGKLQIQFFYILLNYKSKRIELEAVLIESSLLDEIIRTSNVEEYAKGVIQDLAP